MRKLTDNAPGIELSITGMNERDFLEPLRRHLVDILILPREILPESTTYAEEVLFKDDYLIAVPEDHPTVTDSFSREQMESLPYATYVSGSNPSIADAQLDRLGVALRTRVTANSFLLAPLQLPHTPLFQVIHGQLARLLAPRMGLKLFPSPVDLQPTTQVMLWNPSMTTDAGLIWLRQQLRETAANLPPHPLA